MLNKYVGLSVKSGVKCCVYLCYSVGAVLLCKAILNALSLSDLLGIFVGGIIITTAFLPLALSAKSLRFNRKLALKNRVRFL